MISYKATAVGENLSGFAGDQGWFRVRYGSICFDTELQCRTSASGRSSCKPASPAR